MNRELPDIQVGFRKGRGTRDQIVNICWIIKKSREFQKNMYFFFIDHAKAFDFVDHNKLWKFWKRWEYQTTWPASWETHMQVRKQQLELDMEQQTGSKQEKEYIKAVYCHPAYLMYMQSASWETLGLEEAQAGIKIARRNTNNLIYADHRILMAESKEKLKPSSWKWKRRVKKLA